MPLPIIIMLERHWDTEGKSALMQSLNLLNKYGYDTLCFESPYELSQEETVQETNSTIDFIKTQYTQASALLASREINAPFLELPFEQLRQLLLMYVSSRYSAEMALWFKELPGCIKKLELMKHGIDLGMKICGIDLDKEALAPLRNMNTGTHLGSRVQAIDKLDEKRIQSFKENLLQFQREGRGVIFTVGQSHYEKLVLEFQKEYFLEEIIFIHPHSCKSLDTSLADAMEYLSYFPDGIEFINQRITNQNDIDEFLIKFYQKVEEKVNFYEQIPLSAAATMLNKKTNISFEAFQRPSKYVDCFYPLNEDQNISTVVSTLEQQGIHGYYSFFKQKESYCIPCINSDEIGKRIQQLEEIKQPVCEMGLNII